MEFGIYLRRAKTFQNMLELALRAEKLGFQGAYINDHVQGFGDNKRDGYLEAWTTMTGIGMQTTKLRVGQVVIFNSLRNPAYLAKSVATLDNMIGGRYELLLGAGWNAPEYEAYDLMEGGRGMPSAKERVDRFEESIQIIRSMLHNEVTNFNGKYWKLKEALNIPQPVQKTMRISVGCSKPRMMNITAKYANGLNLPTGLGNLATLLNDFQKVTAYYNKDLSDYYLSMFPSINLVKTDDEARKAAKPIAERQNVSVDEVLQTTFIGNVEDLISKFRKIRDMGINLAILIIEEDSQFDHKSLEYLCDNVLTQL